MADIEVDIHIDAPPARVWGLVGDPTRMGEWSPETTEVAWTGGRCEPALGARFKGRNRLGRRRWSTGGTIVAYQPEREIAWDVATMGLDIARWAYRIVPADGGGCTLVEAFTDQRGVLMTKVLGPIVRGVRDTEGHNRTGMEATLANVKAAAEA